MIFVLYTKYWREASKDRVTLAAEIMAELQKDDVTFDSVTLSPADARVTDHKHVRSDNPRYPCCILVEVVNPSKTVTINHERIADRIGDRR